MKACKLVARTLNTTIYSRFSKIPQQKKQQEKSEEQKRVEENIEKLQLDNEDGQGFERSQMVAVASIFGMGLISFVIFYKVAQYEEQKINKPQPQVQKPEVGGTWQLTSTNSKICSSAQLRGNYYLIYFGYTSCPDICPSSMSRITRALKKLKNASEMRGIPLKMIFVSIDPERDTVEKVNKFLSFFNYPVIGQIGTREEIEDMLDNFRISVQKQEANKDALNVLYQMIRIIINIYQTIQTCCTQ